MQGRPCRRSGTPEERDLRRPDRGASLARPFPDGRPLPEARFPPIPSAAQGPVIGAGVAKFLREKPDFYCFKKKKIEKFRLMVYIPNAAFPEGIARMEAPQKPHDPEAFHIGAFRRRKRSEADSGQPCDTRMNIVLILICLCKIVLAPFGACEKNFSFHPV
jgi:hypothetical protein